MSPRFPKSARPGRPYRGENYAAQKPTKTDPRTGNIGKKARKKGGGKK